MLTQGRLVPRQPWAIKRTTRTELRGENIRHDGFTHGNAGIISTALRFFNFISCQKEERRKGCLQIDEPHRGSAFDSPRLPNDSAGYPGLGYGL